MTAPLGPRTPRTHIPIGIGPKPLDKLAGGHLLGHSSRRGGVAQPAFTLQANAVRSHGFSFAVEIDSHQAPPWRSGSAVASVMLPNASDGRLSDMVGNCLTLGVGNCLTFDNGDDKPPKRKRPEASGRLRWPPRGCTAIPPQYTRRRPRRLRGSHPCLEASHFGAVVGVDDEVERARGHAVPQLICQGRVR